jgi:hypothetical protein
MIDYPHSVEILPIISSDELEESPRISKVKEQDHEKPAMLALF